MDSNLSYVYRKEPPESLEEPAPNLLDKWAEKTPDKEAFVHVDQTNRRALTFRQFAHQTKNLAAWFVRNFSLKKGDRVAIFSKNCLEYGLVDFALLRIGVLLTKLYTTFSAQQDLPDMIQRSQSRLLLVQAESMDKVLEFIPELLFRRNGERLDSFQFPELEQVITFGEARDGFLKFVIDYKANAEELKLVEEIQSELKMSGESVIQLTSGSTGKSKIGVISMHGYTNMNYQTFSASGLTDTDVLFTDRPMAHALGSIIPILQFGCTMVVCDSVLTIRDANTKFLCELLHKEKVTAAIFLPYIIYDILNTTEDLQVFSNLKFAISAGQNVPRDVMAQIRDIVTIVNNYGCTEIGDICSTKLDDDLETMVSKVGRPIPNIQVRIVDENGEILPRNTPGMLEVKSKSFIRYQGDEERTRESLRNGWFRPGDVAEIDEQDRVKLHGRATEVICIAARKIYPTEIENVLQKHSKIDKSVAFGVPDERLYERIGVCVKPKAKEVITEAEVLDWFSRLVSDDEVLTGLACKPSHVIVRQVFPVTSSGKVDRRAIKELCLKELRR